MTYALLLPLNICLDCRYCLAFKRSFLNSCCYYPLTQPCAYKWLSVIQFAAAYTIDTPSIHVRRDHNGDILSRRKRCWSDMLARITRNIEQIQEQTTAANITRTLATRAVVGMQSVRNDCRFIERCHRSRDDSINELFAVRYLSRFN
jgi:hypothetical protein